MALILANDICGMKFEYKNSTRIQGINQIADAFPKSPLSQNYNYENICLNRIGNWRNYAIGIEEN